MFALIVWTVFCIGLSLLAASEPLKGDFRSTKAMRSFGVGAVVWSVGVGLWWGAGVLVAALQ